jgi:hypothetical protein
MLGEGGISFVRGCNSGEKTLREKNLLFGIEPQGLKPWFLSGFF